MNRWSYVLAGLCLSLFSVTSWGQAFNLQTLSTDDENHLVDEFSANFSHTSLSGASSLGRIFGFEVGVVGGLTNTPNLNRIVQNYSSSTDVSKIPTGELLGVLTIPLGFTFDVGYVPKVSQSGFNFSAYALAAKWTLTDVIPLPISLAAKVHYMSATLDTSTTSSTIDTVDNYKSKVIGETIFVSKNFEILEPYLGLGLLSGHGDLTSTVTNLVGPPISTVQTANITRTSTQFLAGVELKLVAVKLGVEYAKMFGTDRIAGKLSLFF